MQDLISVWLLMLLVLSLACNLAYICRDMVRERRRKEREQIRKYRERISGDRRA